MVKEYSQQEGIKYQETFSSVVKMVTVISILTIATTKAWHIDQNDVYTAFLQGALHDKIYMDLPQGIQSQEE